MKYFPRITYFTYLFSPYNVMSEQIAKASDSYITLWMIICKNYAIVLSIWVYHSLKTTLVAELFLKKEY